MMEKRKEPQTRTSLLYQQARRYHQAGDLGEAVPLYAKVLVARPRHTPSLLHLAEIAWRTGNLDQAVVLLQRALTIDPQYAEAYEVFWQVRKAQQQYGSAELLLRRLIELRRHDGEHYYHLAVLQQERGFLAEAGALFEQALRYRPDDEKILFAAGELLHQQGRIEAATEKFRLALVQAPRNPAYHAQYGLLLAQCGRAQESLLQLERAIILKPGDISFRQLQWQTLLRLGRLPEGLAAAHRFSPKIPGVAVWDGKPFVGRLLIFPATEMEDLLQYARYLPQVKEMGGTVILALPKPLMRLFNNLLCVDEIIEASPKGLVDSKADVAISISSLPHLFNTTLDSIPAHSTYLFADPFLTHSWVRRLDWKTFRIGLVWSTDTQSIPVVSAERLMQLPGISWYPLQLEETVGLRDYADIAALAANLDLIIAVDSPQAHLAAAIGRPVWTLLSFEAHWRWLDRREDSPWYPTMRLFRQRQPGDWDEVIQRVADALRPRSRPFRQLQPLQGKPREFFADSAVTYSC